MATTDETTAKDLSRDFFAYDKSGHYRERVACDRRPITDAHARDAVECGRVERNPVDTRDTPEWRFRHDVDGLEVVVVAGRSNVPGRGLRLFTAFVDVDDPNRAWASDTWSSDDVEAAALLHYLMAGEEGAIDKYPVRNIDVGEPIPYRGHMVVCNQGFATAYCLKCHRDSIDGDDFGRWSCGD